MSEKKDIKKKDIKKKDTKKKDTKKKDTKKKTVTKKKIVAKKKEIRRGPRKTKRTSVSGKYKSIRNMMEILFAKNKDITEDEVWDILIEEYPESSWVINDTNHYSWYRTIIVSNKEFTTIDPPKWTEK